MEYEKMIEDPMRMTTGSRLRSLAKSYPERDEGLEAWILATLPDLLIGWIMGSCESRAREGFYLDSFVVLIDGLVVKSVEMKIGLPSMDIDQSILLLHRRSCERILPWLVSLMEDRLSHDGFAVHVTIHHDRVVFDLGWT